MKFPAVVRTRVPQGLRKRGPASRFRPGSNGAPVGRIGPGVRPVMDDEAPSQTTPWSPASRSWAWCRLHADLGPGWRSRSGALVVGRPDAGPRKGGDQRPGPERPAGRQGQAASAATASTSSSGPRRQERAGGSGPRRAPRPGHGREGRRGEGTPLPSRARAARAPAPAAYTDTMTPTPTGRRAAAWSAAGRRRTRRAPARRRTARSR